MNFARWLAAHCTLESPSRRFEKKKAYICTHIYVFDSLSAAAVWQVETSFWEFSCFGSAGGRSSWRGFHEQKQIKLPQIFPKGDHEANTSTGRLNKVYSIRSKTMKVEHIYIVLQKWCDWNLSQSWSGDKQLCDSGVQEVENGTTVDVSSVRPFKKKVKKALPQTLHSQPRLSRFSPAPFSATFPPGSFSFETERSETHKNSSTEWKQTAVGYLHVLTAPPGDR